MNEALATTYAHLSASYAAVAAQDNEARIRAIQLGSWIAYPRATEVMAKMEELLNHPPITRMPSMLLVAPSFNGKTSILERFVSKHPPIINPEAEATECPVVFVEAPSGPDIGEFYSLVLEALMAPYKASASVRELGGQVRTLFRLLKVRMLVIDEIQHLIAGGNIKQQEFRNAVKTLSNRLKFTIVSAGVETAFNAFNTDPQMSSRFPPMTLPKWSMNQDYADVLATLEHRTPLRKPSNLVEPGLASAILLRSEGTLGDICDLVKTAAIDAIRTGKEQITLARIKQLDWAAPSARRRMPTD